jgi:hypothetical protein
LNCKEKVGKIFWTTLKNTLKQIKKQQAIDFHTSKLKLSYKLGETENWNEQTILQRSKELALEASQIWSYPQTNYQAKIEEKEIYSLDEEVDFTGTKPKFLYFKEKSFTVRYWRDILKIMCNELYAFSPTEFNLLIQNSELQKYFATNQNKENLRDPIAFNNNKYVDGNQSANSIISFSKKLCEYLGFDKSQVEVELI